MKRCPHCRRDYFDESLLYCLDDGTALLEGPSTNETRTAILPESTSYPATATLEKTQVFESTISTDGDGQKTSAIEQRPSSNKSVRRTVVLIGLVALLVAAGSAIYKYSNRRTPISFASAEFTRLTSTGNAAGVAISPDGKYVAHIQDDGGSQSLWVAQVATGSSVQLIAPSTAVYRGLTFTPDSNYIYYAVDESGDQKGTLYQLPSFGGTPKKLLTGIANSVAFSPNGKQMAFFRTTTVEDARYDALMIANIDGSGERVLAYRRGDERFHRGNFSNPSWSPDGKRIACPIGTITENQMSVATVSVETGEVKTVTDERWFSVRQVAWVDNETILFNANINAGTQYRIWQVSTSNGQVSRVTNDPISHRMFSLTASSDALAAIQASGTANIWIAPIDDVAKARPVTQGLGFNADVAWTKDEGLVYATDAAGYANLFRADLRGGSPRQLTSGPSTSRYPRVSPDGRYIVFMSDRKGRPTIWRSDADGGNQIQLTDGSDLFPDISPDGQWIVYQSWNDGKHVLMRVSINGGEPMKLTDYPSGRPTFSPDGKFIACTFSENRVSPVRLALISSAGGPPLKTFSVPNEGENLTIFRWAPNGREVVSWRTENGVSNLWSQPIDGGQPKQITNFTSDRIFWFDYSPDGKQFAVSRGKLIGDVFLVSNLK